MRIARQDNPVSVRQSFRVSLLPTPAGPDPGRVVSLSNGRPSSVQEEVRTHAATGVAEIAVAGYVIVIEYTREAWAMFANPEARASRRTAEEE